MKTRWCCPPTSQTTSSCAKATAATAHCRAGAHPPLWPHNVHVTIVLGGQARKNTQKTKHPSNALKRFPIADKPLKKSQSQPRIWHLTAMQQQSQQHNVHQPLHIHSSGSAPSLARAPRSHHSIRTDCPSSYIQLLQQPQLQPQPQFWSHHFASL